MQALLSRTAGVLLWEDAKSEPPVVHHIAPDDSWTGIEQTHLLSSICDWEEVQASDPKSLVEQATCMYWLERAASMLRCALAGVSTDLELEVLEHVEELLQTHTSSNRVLSMLLVAPLREPQTAQQLAQHALAANLSAVGALLDSLADLQPLVSRLVEQWLSLPESEFADIERSRQDIWRDIADQGTLLRVLPTSSRDAFRTEWNTQVFKEKLPASRTAIAQIGAELAAKLFPGASSLRYDALSLHKADSFRDEPSPSMHDLRITGWEALESALKQVNAIADAVSAGKDSQALKFLRDLVDVQERRGDEIHAVKTLCNVAQRCAEMFRSDFERLCLEKARTLAPADPWTLIQWGDHLKRVGDFDGAIKSLERAAVGEHAQVALSSIADVWAENGDYARAISVYKSCPGWEDIVQIRTGIADIQRHRGSFDEAIQRYDDILRRWPGTDRAIAGKAEIAKRKGEIHESLSLYDSLLERPDIDDRTRRVYRFAKCSILKQANRLEEALSLTDAIVQQAPFFMSARANRGAILGLLGREVEGLKDVPVSKAPAAFREWFQGYVRGLLLLKLERYSEAKQQLVDKMKGALLSGDENTITRLGAAYSFVCEEHYGEAEESLGSLPEIRDHYIKYLSLVLKLHIAVARSQNDRVAAISRELGEACRSDEDLASVVDAIRRRDFRTARTHELAMLLRIGIAA